MSVTGTEPGLPWSHPDADPAGGILRALRQMETEADGHPPLPSERVSAVGGWPIRILGHGYLCQPNELGPGWATRPNPAGQGAHLKPEASSASPR